MPEPGFAVIDFETTGLFPGRHDRIIEIGVVHVDPAGRITGRWDTLVNPGRDLGPQRIHGIGAAEVLDAPTFADVAGHLVELLRGRVLVAHNARFDVGFLTSELERIGYGGVAGVEALCTMLLAREFLPGTGRSLADCCDACGITISEAHRAVSDAEAAARLLGVFIELGNREAWDAAIDAALRSTWSTWSSPLPRESVWRPRSRGAEAPRDFLDRLQDRMPELAGPDEHQVYLALLDRCMADRHLSEHETRELVRTADELGIGRATGSDLHRQYFEALAAIAWSDGVLSADEVADLVRVARMLHISDQNLTKALSQPQMVVASVPPADIKHAAAARFNLAPGAEIVLTGDMARPRAEWHTILLERGFVPRPAVTKRIHVVAAADPDSLSGKARKARAYGIPIVSEDWLCEHLSV
jgi:DNA polymerase-3 subunit epsilon